MVIHNEMSEVVSFKVAKEIKEKMKKLRRKLTGARNFENMLLRGSKR